MDRPAATGLAQSHTARVLGCALAIFVLYSAFGILQEKITRSKYGPKGEKFHFTFMLVFIQCVANTILAQAVIMLRGGNKKPIQANDSKKKADGESGQNADKQRETADAATSSSSVPIMHLYFACAMSYMSAMLASNYSLQFVNYPTQVLAKSCKPIPVMLLGVLLAHKRYPPLKYLFVLLITVGVAMFMYNPRKAAKQTVINNDSGVGFGEFLLCFSLLLDGVTGVFQERLRRRNVKSHHLMLWINIFSSVALGILSTVSGEIFEFIPFIQRHNHVLGEMLLFALCSALGQYFIFIAVIEFGPLMLAIITTTRKFFSVLFSVVVFGNEMMPHQWLATALVFAGLLADSIYSKKSSSPPASTTTTTPSAKTRVADVAGGKKKLDDADETEPLLESSYDENFVNADKNVTGARRRIPYSAAGSGEPAAVEREAVRIPGGAGDAVYAKATGHAGKNVEL